MSSGSTLTEPATTALERIEHLDRLDPLVDALRSVLERLPVPRRVLDLLHGVDLGHPAHPMLVQVPTGAWTSAGVLDAVPGTARAADGLVAVGLVAAAPAALAGLADWSTLHPQQQRVGLVHATGNLAAVALYSASLAARRAGRRGLGRVLGYAGLAAVSAGGFIGGHLAYRQAAGPNHAEHVAHLVEPGWHDIGALADLPDGRLAGRRVGDVGVCVLRQGGDVLAVADVCSHLSGPLHEGDQQTSAQGDACVVCPWHGSTFRLEDGAVVHGPATAPQPAFRSRVRDGRVELLLEGAG